MTDVSVETKLTAALATGLCCDHSWTGALFSSKKSHLNSLQQTQNFLALVTQLVFTSLSSITQDSEFHCRLF